MQIQSDTGTRSALQSRCKSHPGEPTTDRTYVYTCLCMQETVRSTSAPSWSGIGQVARPVFHKTSGRVTEIAGRRRGSSASSALATSRLFVLPVVARQWVSVDNSLPTCIRYITSFSFSWSVNLWLSDGAGLLTEEWPSGASWNSDRQIGILITILDFWWMLITACFDFHTRTNI